MGTAMRHYLRALSLYGHNPAAERYYKLYRKRWWQYHSRISMGKWNG